MENQSWLKKLARRLGPGHVVNLCFIVVLLFSTLLTWREVVVLEDAYISSQRNHLENVANALDKHLQYNVDKLIFLRNGMREALVAPLDFTSLRNAVTEFEQHRDEHAWQIELNRRRTLSVNGVSDALVSEGNLLSRENESLDNEITAALEVGYLLRLAHNTSSMVEQAMYARVPDFTFRRSRPCLRAMYQRVITAMSPNPGLSAIRNEKIVTAQYAGLLRNRNTPAILNRRLPSVFQ
ncbi:hypothetical protein EC2726800_2508 [Escherichia coli 2726800]|nr:hypothetical protein EC2726800_2508 [Escherichia coli 2726800]